MVRLLALNNETCQKEYFCCLLPTYVTPYRLQWPSSCHIVMQSIFPEEVYLIENVGNINGLKSCSQILRLLNLYWWQIQVHIHGILLGEVKVHLWPFGEQKSSWHVAQSFGRWPSNRAKFQSVATDEVQVGTIPNKLVHHLDH